MASEQFGAKPAVLRCARRGKFVGWEEAARCSKPTSAGHFDQHRGYRLTDLVPKSIIVHAGQEVAGFAGIPVRAEVRLEKRLS